MKTRKYFCFVCILIIFTVVFSACRSGTREDGDDEEPQAEEYPEFRRSTIYRGEQHAKDFPWLNLDKDKYMQMDIMGTFDESTWRGIELRFHKALEKGELFFGYPDQNGWVEPIISDDVLWETFSYEVKSWFDDRQSSSYKSAIVVDNGQSIDYDYEWYIAATGEKTLYEISGFDERYFEYDFYTGEDGITYQRVWNRFENVLYINYNKINELLVPIEDYNDFEMKPALAVAILALHRAVTTGFGGWR